MVYRIPVTVAKFVSEAKHVLQLSRLLWLHVRATNNRNIKHEGKASCQNSSCQYQGDPKPRLPSNLGKQMNARSMSGCQKIINPSIHSQVYKRMSNCNICGYMQKEHDKADKSRIPSKSHPRSARQAFP